MKPFEKCLQEELDSLPTPESVPEGSVARARMINNQLRETEAHILNLQSSLQHTLESLNAKLAVEIRKRMTKLNVGLSRNRIDISYRSKTLSCWPNIDRAIWEVEMNETGRYFMRTHWNQRAEGVLTDLNLSDDLTEVAERITEFFSSNYKTLQDNSVVHGVPSEAVGETAVGATENPINEPQPNDIGAGRAIQRKGTQRPGTGSYA